MNEWVLGLCGIAGALAVLGMWREWRDRREMQRYRLVMRRLAYAVLQMPEAAALRDMAEKMPQDWDRDEMIRWAQARERLQRVVRLKAREDGEGIEIWIPGEGFE